MISFLQIILILIGLFLLTKGANWFVDGTVGIAETFRIPHLVIGLTIVAMGTSAPEAAVCIMGVLSNNESIAIGNVLGSNIINSLLVLGVCGIVGTLSVGNTTRFVELPYMIAVTVLFAALSISGYCITFTDDLILWGAFLLYIGYMIYRAKKDAMGQLETTEEAKILLDSEQVREKKPFLRHLFLFLLGLLFLFASSEMIVNAAEILAKAVGLSDRLIALTVVALGTSLPELFTSITAARKGKTEFVLGTIIGSNIFNLLFVMGITGLIRALQIETAFVADFVVVLVAGLLLWICVLPKKQLNKVNGSILLGCYVAYVIFRSAG